VLSYDDAAGGYRKRIAELETLLDIERRLRYQAEKQLGDLFDLSSDWLVVTDSKGQVKRANANFISAINYSGNETIGTLIRRHLHPDDIRITLQSLRKVAKGSHQNLVFRCRDASGSYSWWSCNVAASEHDDTVVGVVRNISDLKESERRQADIINFLPDATFVINQNGKVIAWNKAIEEMTGVKADDMLGRGDYEYSLPFYGEKRPILIDLINLIDTGIEDSYLSMERDITRISAESFCPLVGERGSFLYGTASPLLNSSGKLVGAIESIRDISFRRKTEAALRQSEEKFSKAFHGSPIMMCLATLEQGTFIDANEAFCRTIGYTRQEMIGRTSCELNFYVEGESRLFFNLLIEKGRIEHFPLSFRNKSGEIRDGLLWSQLLDIDGLPSHIACIIDITEQNRLKKEMARLDRLKLVGEMAASIGHEIRNPMTTIRGFLQLLINKEAYQDDRDYFELMIEELDRANEIISEYLGMAQDKLVDLQPRYLDQAVKSIYPMIQADANIREMKICLELTKPPIPLIDEKEIRQMIINLARNGLEAMSPGGTLTIGTRTEPEEIVLYIKDEGPGIDPMIVDQIGTPFLTTKEKGTGLGLAVCYSIAARHNASIDFKTGPSGTSFFVRFPYSPMSP
jgi:PAS domain S-box-containing protein